jgi:L-ascorbate metabolism protein UlaG (beta-lactamase superfamily)
VEAEGQRIIIDPFLSGNPNCGVDPLSVKADAIILTHGHDDHFGDTLEIARNNNCVVIAVFELAMYCESKGVQVHAMNIGGAHRFAGFDVKYTLAFHGSSVREGDQLIYAGQPGGVLLTMGGKTLYHAGDTALFSDMKLIGERNRINVAALPIGDNYTMGPDDAAIAAQWIGAETVIPIHYNTFPGIVQDTTRFADLLKPHGIACAALKSGESLQL